MTDNNKYLDDYGYPTSAVLAKIETWEINSNSTAMPTVWNCWSFVGSFGTTPNISEVKTASILLLPLVGLEMNPLSHYRCTSSESNVSPAVLVFV